MEENNIALRKILAKECTQSLAYKDGVFSFPIREYINEGQLRAIITAKSIRWNSDDVNDILAEFRKLHTAGKPTRIDAIRWSDLLVSEVMEVEFEGMSTPMRMMKVARNALLTPGGGLVRIADDMLLKPGASLHVGSASQPAVVDCIRLVPPSVDHIVFSDVYIGSFYRRAIADDLRPLLAEAQSIINEHGDCTPLLHRAKELHIGVFQLLNLLNLSCNGLS